MFIGAALVTGDIGLLILAGVFWLCEGLPTPTYSGIVQKIYPIESRGTLMSVVRVGMSVTLLVLAPVAGRILDGPGYRVLFPVAGVLGIVAALIFGRLKFDQSELRLSKTPSPRNFGSILKHDTRYSFYLGAVVFWGLAALVPSAVIPFVQVDRLHISYTELGWLNLALSLVRLPAYYYFGRAVDRIGPVRCLQYACLLNLVVVLPYIWVTQAWMLIPTFVASGIVGAAVDLALINAAIQLARDGKIQEYSALQSMIIGVRGMIAPFIGVAMLRVGASPALVFVAAGACSVIAALLLVKVKLPSFAYGED